MIARRWPEGGLRPVDDDRMADDVQEFETDDATQQSEVVSVSSTESAPSATSDKLLDLLREELRLAFSKCFKYHSDDITDHILQQPERVDLSIAGSGPGKRLWPTWSSTRSSRQSGPGTSTRRHRPRTHQKDLQYYLPPASRFCTMRYAAPIRVILILSSRK